MKKIILIVSVVLVLALLVSCYITEEEQNMEGAKMTAVIKNIADKIEVEVIEGDYNVSGIYWVNISSDTVFTDENNVRLSLSDLNVGDIIEITYSGQVALSYPPQISARKIQIK